MGKRHKKHRVGVFAVFEGKSARVGSEHITGTRDSTIARCGCGCGNLLKSIEVFIVWRVQRVNMTALVGGSGRATTEDHCAHPPRVHDVAC